jgi:DNA repair exonuclease SbcCD ATPase subunit
MRLQRIEIEGLGELQHFLLEPGTLTALFDANETGKTTVVDALVRVLFHGPRKVFPGADRFKDEGTVQVTLSHRGETHTFPRSEAPKSLAEWLGWKEPEVGRLLFVRAGELALTAERRSVQRLWDALGVLLAGGARVSRVIERVLYEASLTKKRKEWQQKLQQEIGQRIRRYEELQDLRNTALALQERERVVHELEQQLQMEKEALEKVGEMIRNLERQIRAARYHEAKKCLNEWEQLGGQLDRDFARYTEEDLNRWQGVEYKLTTFVKRREEARLGLSEAEQVVRDAKLECEDARKAQIQAENRHQQAQEAIEHTEGQVTEERQRWRKTADEVRSAKADWRAARDMAEGHAGQANFAKLGLGVGFLLFASGILGAILGELLPGAIAAVIGLLIVVLSAIGVNLQRGREGLTQKRVEILLGAASQCGLDVVYPEVVSSALEAAEREHEAKWQTKIGEANQELNQASTDLARIEEKYQGAQRKIEQSRDKREQARKQLQEIEEQIDKLEQLLRDLHNRTGLPNVKTLEEKVNQKRKLIGQRIELEGHIRTLLREDDPNRWQTRLQQIAIELEDVERPTEAIEALEAQLKERRQERNRLLQDYEGIRNESELRNKEYLRDHTALQRHNVERPQDVYLHSETLRDELQEYVHSRLTALAAVQLLERMQSDHQRFLDDALAEGAANASELFCRITRRYQRIQYDRKGGNFLAFLPDGHYFDENQLSTSAWAQLFFALRLALTTRLFTDEPGFLILDDPFINYDHERKTTGVDLIGEWCQQGWQVLYFTVDEIVAKLFQERLHFKPISIAQCTN